MQEKSLDDKLKILYGNRKPQATGKIQLKTIENEQFNNRINSKYFKDEAALQWHIIKWLKKWYPGVHFRTDWFAGNFCPPWVKEQYQAAQSSSAYPDLEILKRTSLYTGLHIEIKLEPKNAFLVDGVTLQAIPHVHNQYEYIRYLQNEGKCAVFGCGDILIKQMIKDYMNGLEVKQTIIQRPLAMSKLDQNIENKADEFFRRNGL